MRHKNLERLQKEQEAQELLAERVQQEAATLELVNAKKLEEQTLLAQTLSLQAELKNEVDLQKENTLALQNKIDAEKRAAEALTKQLLDRFTLEQGQHQQWCERAKEVLQASPIPVEISDATPFTVVKKNTGLRSPVLFSVLMGIGMAGAVSWSMLQAQASSVVLSHAGVTNVAPAAKVSPTNISPIVASDKTETLRMSYQLNPEAK